MNSGSRRDSLHESPSPVVTEHLSDSGSERSADDHHHQDGAKSLILPVVNNSKHIHCYYEVPVQESYSNNDSSSALEGSTMLLEDSSETKERLPTEGDENVVDDNSATEKNFEEESEVEATADSREGEQREQAVAAVDDQQQQAQEIDAGPPAVDPTSENGHVEGIENRGKEEKSSPVEEADGLVAVAIPSDNDDHTPVERSDSDDAALPDGKEEAKPEHMNGHGSTATIDAPASAVPSRNEDSDDGAVDFKHVRSTDPPPSAISSDEEASVDEVAVAEASAATTTEDMEQPTEDSSNGAIPEPEPSETGVKEAVDAPARGQTHRVKNGSKEAGRPIDASPTPTMRKVIATDFDEKKDETENVLEKAVLPNLVVSEGQEKEESIENGSSSKAAITTEAVNNHDDVRPAYADSGASSVAKKPMDASGRCSLDMQAKKEVPTIQDPPENDNTAKPPTLAEIKEAMGEESNSSRNQLPTLEPLHSTHLSQVPFEAQPTPLAATTRKMSNAAEQLAAEVDVALPVQQATQSHLSQELLANKDKESFGLLARGESFRSQQQPIMQQNVIDYSKVPQHRVPQEPDAVHRRGDSSMASQHSRRNSGHGGDVYNDSHHLVTLDDNSNRPIDDNSWRPTHVNVSYPPPHPHSPQGLPAPQAPMSMGHQGAYMMMPQHQQVQPAPHAFMPPPPAPAMMHPQTSFHSHQAQLLGRQSFGYGGLPAMAPMSAPPPAMAPMSSSPAPPSGKRKIRLKLQEEILARPAGHNRRGSFFFRARSTRRLLSSEPLLEDEHQPNEVNRGTITVSWFEGTSTSELVEHVNRSMARKLKLEPGHKLDDIRILDTKVEPPEEVVLSPYIPSGSEFVVRYKIQQESGRVSPAFIGPPDSPSAAPSPFPSHGNLAQLGASQLAALRKQLDSVQANESRKNGKQYRNRLTRSQLKGNDPNERKKDESHSPKENRSAQESDGSDNDNESETNTLQPESSMEAKLTQITELLLMDRQRDQQRHYRYPQVEKRQVVFVLANYFVLFVALITISAEIQARAPEWLSWVESQLENVQNCSADQEALYQCITNGEFAGLFATVILWLSRSAMTKRIFLFGFDSPQKLWTVFYESLVGAFCWGVSYMFIRRGMNPDTRPQFLQKYWKDAIYGSLAGFNATFMKNVLKNLIPQEAVEEAFLADDRKLKILSWLPNFA